MVTKSNLNIQEKLLEYVNAKLFNKKIVLPPPTVDEMNDFFHEAKSQQVECLIYDEVVNSLSGQEEYKRYLDHWRNFVMMRTLRHKQSCSGVSKIFDAFNQSGIQYVTFKGYVFKELYPNPEMRYMSDVDLYVDKENLEAASKLLINLGYLQKEDPNHPFHLTFKRDGHIDIELHYNFFHDDLFHNDYYLEEHIWDQTRTIVIDGVNVCIPSLEHTLIHGILHITTHFTGSGFGLRQLIDICLFLEKNIIDISFDTVQTILQNYKLIKIFAYIIEMCNRFFYKNFCTLEVEIQEEKLSCMIKLLFNSGVFGRKSYANEINRIIIQQSLKRNIKAKSSFRLKMIILFPSSKRIGQKYGYAKKNKILLPFAWIHRIVSGFINPSQASNELIHHRINVKSIEEKTELYEYFGLKIDS